MKETMKGHGFWMTRREASPGSFPGCRRLSWLMLLTAATAGPASADLPRSPDVMCTGGGLAETPKFGRRPPGVAEYHFSGVCQARAGTALGYRLAATWTPSESEPTNANATEIVQVDTLSGPSQHWTVILGARCETDPWLDRAANCVRVGDNMPDDLRALWPSLVTGLFPYSRYAILNNEQTRLRSEYARVNPTPVHAIGRAKRSTEPGLALPVCEAARLARERNSPVADTLEARCRAQIPVTTPDLNQLAIRGAQLVTADRLAARLRSQQADDASRLGFDIGMGAADGQTEDGPGKQALHDGLPVSQQAGFTNAVKYSIDRNRYSRRIAIAEAIAQADPEVATARAAEADAFFELGFDIATAIFGDPAFGAQGNTATGPGSLAVRDSLNAAGRRGFDAAVALHLGRTY